MSLSLFKIWHDGTRGGVSKYDCRCCYTGTFDVCVAQIRLEYDASESLTFILDIWPQTTMSGYPHGRFSMTHTAAYFADQIACHNPIDNRVRYPAKVPVWTSVPYQDICMVSGPSYWTTTNGIYLCVRHIYSEIKLAATYRSHFSSHLASNCTLGLYLSSQWSFNAADATTTYRSSRPLWYVTIWGMEYNTAWLWCSGESVLVLLWSYHDVGTSGRQNAAMMAVFPGGRGHEHGLFLAQHSFMPTAFKLSQQKVKTAPVMIETYRIHEYINNKTIF